MTFDPPLPASVDAFTADALVHHLAAGRWAFLAFAGDQVTHFAHYTAERDRNESAAKRNRTPGSHVRLFNPTA